MYCKLTTQSLLHNRNRELSNSNSTRHRPNQREMTWVIRPCISCHFFVKWCSTLTTLRVFYTKKSQCYIAPPPSKPCLTCCHFFVINPNTTKHKPMPQAIPSALPPKMTWAKRPCLSCHFFVKCCSTLTVFYTKKSQCDITPPPALVNYPFNNANSPLGMAFAPPGDNSHG